MIANRLYGKHARLQDCKIKLNYGLSQSHENGNHKGRTYKPHKSISERLTLER